MAIRAALNVARWLLFALFAIIKMHYSPSTPAPSVFSPSSLYPVATGSFSFGRRASHLFLLPSLFRRADRSFGYLLFMSRRTPPSLPGSSSRLRYSSIPPPSPLLRGMLVERKWEEEPLPPSSSFQFKFASAQERGAFHSQTRPCLSRLDQRRTFRHLINPVDRRARVSKCRGTSGPRI